MKILYVNWVDYLDAEKRGGGVSLYQRNLMRALSKTPDVEASFIAAGTSYDPVRPAPRWEKMRHGPSDNRDRRFDLVNSGTLAPSHASFGDPSQISDPATEKVFFDFLAKTGPYDVVHFNNLEGLPADVLRLKERFPGTRVILSLHNYYPFCPQVNFWQKEARNCRDDDAGKRCVRCLPYQWPASQIRAAHSLAYRLKVTGLSPKGLLFSTTFRLVFGVGRRIGRVMGKRNQVTALARPKVDRAAGEAFLRRRETMVELINRNADLVLCVSDRVRQIAVHHGIQPEKAVANYIGTVEAERFATATERAPILRADGTIKLAYFGYMRRDKGFYFLLEALESLPARVQDRLHLLVAAKRGEADAMQRLEALAPKLADLTHEDGYTHDDLDELTEDVGVGLVPVMWEDNLPQVAIELHSRRIPLLCSDLGGAQELGNSPDFVFHAGDMASFRERIEALLEGRTTDADYWRAAMAPETMAAHLEKLMAFYRGAAVAAAR